MAIGAGRVDCRATAVANLRIRLRGMLVLEIIAYL